VSEVVSLEYKVYWKIVTTRDFGIPHSRPRVYIIGIRCDSLKTEFVWPRPHKTTASCEELLQPENKDRKFKSDLADGPKKRLKKALNYIAAGGEDPDKNYWFIDIDSSEEFMHWHKECCPCITKSRGTHGFYVTKLNAMMALEEIMAFSGYDAAQPRWRESGISRRAWGQALGDSMSFGVLMRILRQGLHSAGLI
jgi:site-specific DNA-cytosine methylase